MMKLDFDSLESRFNAPVNDVNVTAGDKYIIYMATIRDLEELLKSLRTHAALLLDHAVKR
jgi:uncharacterized protein (DUF1015 family)